MADQTSSVTADATSASQGVNQPSDFTLLVTIATGSGKLQDITSQVMHFNLYESLSSPVMTGDMEMSDALDVVTNFSINGNEWIYVLLDKPGLNKPIRKAFRIYKISNRKFSTTSAALYTIHFCSEELIISSQSYVKRAYAGTIDVMIKNILNDYLKASKKINDANFIKPNGNYSFSISRMRPFQAIEWLSSRAFGANQNLYFFYEDADGFNFTSFEQMIKNAPYATYVYQPNDTADAANNYKSISYLNVDRDFDVLMGVKSGQFASTLHTFDLVSRSFNEKKLQGDSYGKDRLLNNAISTDSTKNRLGNTIFESTDSHTKFVITSDSDPTINPVTPQNWLLQNIQKSAQMKGLRYTINVPSDFELRVGRVVTLHLPAGNPQNPNDAAGEQDKYRSGSNYLITSLRHGISGQVSSTTLELLSDSLNTSLPAAAENSPILQQIKAL